MESFCLPYFLIYVVSAETILFEFGNPKVTVNKAKGHKGAATIQGSKLFKGGNYSREEIIQGRKLYEEIRYV